MALERNFLQVGRSGHQLMRARDGELVPYRKYGVLNLSDTSRGYGDLVRAVRREVHDVLARVLVVLIELGAISRRQVWRRPLRQRLRCLDVAMRWTNL
jgi:hypothetical protein